LQTPNTFLSSDCSTSAAFSSFDNKEVELKIQRRMTKLEAKVAALTSVSYTKRVVRTRPRRYRCFRCRNPKHFAKNIVLLKLAMLARFSLQKLFFASQFRVSPLVPLPEK